MNKNWYLGLEFTSKGNIKFEYSKNAIWIKDGKTKVHFSFNHSVLSKLDFIYNKINWISIEILIKRIFNGENYTLEINVYLKTTSNNIINI